MLRVLPTSPLRRMPPDGHRPATAVLLCGMPVLEWPMLPAGNAGSGAQYLSGPGEARSGEGGGCSEDENCGHDDNHNYFPAEADAPDGHRPVPTVHPMMRMIQVESPVRLLWRPERRSPTSAVMVTRRVIPGLVSSTQALRVEGGASALWSADSGWVVWAAEDTGGS